MIKISKLRSYVWSTFPNLPQATLQKLWNAPRVKLETNGVQLVCRVEAIGRHCVQLKSFMVHLATVGHPEGWITQPLIVWEINGIATSCKPQETWFRLVTPGGFPRGLAATFTDTGKRFKKKGG